VEGKVAGRVRRLEGGGGRCQMGAEENEWVSYGSEANMIRFLTWFFF
jgi:hypothetical protein